MILLRKLVTLLLVFGLLFIEACNKKKPVLPSHAPAPTTIAVDLPDAIPENPAEPPPPEVVKNEPEPPPVKAKPKRRPVRPPRRRPRKSPPLHLRPHNLRRRTTIRRSRACGLPLLLTPLSPPRCPVRRSPGRKKTLLRLSMPRRTASRTSRGRSTMTKRP
jgi:hypothetical protein